MRMFRSCYPEPPEQIREHIQRQPAGSTNHCVPRRWPKLSPGFSALANRLAVPLTPGFASRLKSVMMSPPAIHVLRQVLICGVISLGARAAVLPVVPGDSERGEKLFETERCIQCHSIDGKGGKTAPESKGRS